MKNYGASGLNIHRLSPLPPPTDRAHLLELLPVPADASLWLVSVMGGCQRMEWGKTWPQGVGRTRRAGPGHRCFLEILSPLLSFPANLLAQQLLGRFAGPGRQYQKSKKRQKYEAEVAPSVQHSCNLQKITNDRNAEESKQKNLWARGRTDERRAWRVSSS